jgi:hypothetical protein
VAARALRAAASNFGGAATDAAGNTYEAGTFTTPTFVLDGATLTSQGGNDGYLAKYTAGGTLAWVRQIGSTGSDAAVDVALDAAGNAYVTGFAGSSLDLGNNVVLNSTSSRAFVVRYSPQGTAEWGQQSVGGSGASVATDAAGSVYVAGNFARTISFDAIGTTTPNNNPGVYLSRFSASTGAPQSIVTAFYFTPGIGPASYPFPKLAVSATGQTSVFNAFSQPVVAGPATYTSRGGTDVLVARYTPQGIFMWAQQFSSTAADFVTDGTLDAAGNVYVAGYFTGSATFGTINVAGTGDIDGYLVKCAAQGTTEWVQTLAGPGPDGFGSVVLDATDNPYVAGNYSAGARLGAVSLSNTGNRDLVVAAYTPQGQLRWTQQAGGPGFDSPSHLGVSANNDLHVLGRFTDNCTFGPFSLSTTASTETFLARLSGTPLSTKTTAPLALSLFPNPATTQVQLPGLPANSRVQLLDALGRVQRETTTSAAAAVSVLGLAPGLYVLRATDAQGRTLAGRVVVE